MRQIRFKRAGLVAMTFMMSCLANAQETNETFSSKTIDGRATPTEAMVSGANKRRASRKIIECPAATKEVVNGIEWSYYDGDGGVCIGSMSEEPAIPNTTLGAVTIPSMLGGKTVVGIGQCAFVNCKNITSINIPNTVTYIGESAFFNCEGLTTLSLPNSLKTIERRAFWYCRSIKSLYIPASVVSISDLAFPYWYELTSIKVDTNNPIYDSRNNCNAIIETASNTLIASCQKTVIPNTVTSLSDYAFFGCGGLKAITIPSSVTSIGFENFNCCYNLTTIWVETGNPVFDSRNNCNGIIETSSNTLVAGCQSTIIPDNVVKIGKSAFWGCFNLTKITIPPSVTVLDNSAFGTCFNLAEITLPESVTSIGWQAFYGCQSLTSIFIPKSVTNLGQKAFANCINMTSIRVDEANTVFDSRNDCNAVIRSNNNTLESGCQTTYIPDDIKTIWPYAFFGCYSLKAINIPNSVTNIGEYAFGGEESSIGHFQDEGDINIDGIMCYIKEPFTINDNVFQNYQAKLYVPKGTKAKYEGKGSWNKFNIIEEMEDSPVCDTDDLQKWIDLLDRRGEKGTVSEPTEVPPCENGLTIDGDITIDDDLQIMINGDGQDSPAQMQFPGGCIFIVNPACGMTFKCVNISSDYGSAQSIKRIFPYPRRTGISNLGSLHFDNCTLTAGSYKIENQAGGKIHLDNNTAVSGQGIIENSGIIYMDGSCSVNGLQHKKGFVYIMSALTNPVTINVDEADINLTNPILGGFLVYTSNGDAVGYEMSEADLQYVSINLPEGFEWYFNDAAKAIYIRTATDVRTIGNVQSTIVKSYDLQGRNITGGKSGKGLHLQYMSDGTVRKTISND